jgi:hypothetical protein
MSGTHIIVTESNRSIRRHATSHSTTVRGDFDHATFEGKA